MFCTLVTEPFDDPAWLFEPKLDGLRVLCRFDGKRATIISRNDKPQDLQFPDIVEGLEDTLSRPAILDGEVVCLDEHGRSSFRALQQRFHLKNEAEIRSRARDYPAYLYVFDLLHHDGKDLRPLPLSRRKRLLKKAVRWSDRIRWTQGSPGDGKRALSEACHAGGEGVVGKKLDSPYYAGRSYEWVKIKCTGRQEFVIGGFTDPQRSRVGLGALLVGYYAEDGKRLIYAGKVGTGYTSQTLGDLRARLDAIGRKDCPFDDAAASPPRGPRVHWVEPKLVAEIEYAEWTQNDLLRQPRFEGLRMDKKAKQVRRERAKSAGAVKAQTGSKKNTSAKGKAAVATARRDVAAPGASLSEYNRKRDFTKTPEPQGKVEKGNDPPVFVVQEHHATRLHYDFRLEVDGVLKSWAVTMEPSSDPSVKRLAVQTEDHPLAYANFEGDIPAGEYGGGHMDVWDRGTYEPATKGRTAAEALEAGKLEVDLRGKKLKGRFALVRMKGRGGGDNWLLIKMKDQHARQGGASDGSQTSKASATAAGGLAPSQKKPGTSANVKIRPTSTTGAPQRVDFSNVDKVMFPEAGVTKGDLIHYYLNVADKLLPHLRDRPVTLERLPDGVGEGQPRFWQKNTPTYYPKWIPRIDLPTAEGKSVQYALVNDPETLAYLVNQGTVTFHPYLSRVSDLNRPDLVVFDFDPGGAKFSDVVRIANTLHEILDKAGVESFPKTSGKSGLHVLVPWTEAGGFDEARAWAIKVAAQVVAALPDVATTERMKDQRRGRVYVDVIQNGPGKHVVPPYVVRATPGATVSTPLQWKEVTSKLDPTKFDVRTAPKRFAKGPDPLIDLTGG
jgi:bifunctional non-homologous end joining protein LigD